MSALRSWDTNLQRSEKRTLYSFLSLYLVLVVMMLAIVSFGYFQVQKLLMLSDKRIELNNYSNELIKSLKHLHFNFDKDKKYPRFENFRSAVYDTDEVQIFSLLENEPHFQHAINLEHNAIQYIKDPEEHYLGARYVVVEVDDDGQWRRDAWLNIAIFGSLFLFVATIFRLFLLKLFLKPMKDAIKLLDHFIKDTTHELNTPLSTILSNIEMIDKESLCPKDLKRLNRINIAGVTVSNLYQDLTYLTLGNKVASVNEMVDMTQLLRDRVEYFSLLINSKDIHVELDLKPCELLIDRAKIARVVDNLLSNAIKYNKTSGKILISTCSRKFSIEDSGVGIAQERLNSIFERYARFNDSIGGFGIGLNIVYMIAKEYGLIVGVKSHLGAGTCIDISW